MPYKIGISTGWWSIAKVPELLGLGRKLGSITTYGVNYAQVDFESTAEFMEPEVVKKIKRIVDSLGIRWGAHGEIGEYMAWESALEIIWKQSHRRLHQYLDAIYENFIKSGYDSYKPEYINFHASNMPSIGMFVERFRYMGHITVDFTGKPDWDEFLKKDLETDPAKKNLFNWFKHNLLFFLIGREAGIAFTSLDDIKKHIIAYAIEQEIKEELKTKPSLTKEEQEEIANRITKKLTESEDELLERGYEMWLELTRLRYAQASISQEEIAYLIIARYLYEKRNESREPLWKLFFGDKKWEDLEKEWNRKIIEFEKGLIHLMPEVVAMVSARYIIGHFEQKNLPEFLVEKKRKMHIDSESWDKFYEKTGFEKLATIKVYFTFENPEIIEGQREGLQRLIHAVDMYRLAKASELMGGEGGKYIKVIVDIEHFLHNGLDPIKEFESCPDDFGNYVVAMHVGAPKPYHPAHEPIDIGSDAQRWIYKYAYLLRKKNFGKNRTGIFIFERGGARGGRTPSQFIGQSAAALKLVVEYLEKDTPPEKLPLKFYGVSPEGLLSMERQRAAIFEHRLEPLKGTLIATEEEHTFLGRAATGKGAPPEKWKKEELR